MNEESLKILNKTVDFLLAHEWTMIPIVYIGFLGTLVLLWAGRVPPSYWFATVLVCIFMGSFSVILPIRGQVLNSRMDSRMRIATVSEQALIESLRWSDPTVAGYPHDTDKAGLLDDGILKRIPDTFLSTSGMQKFALTSRAKKRADKVFSGRLVP